MTIPIFAVVGRPNKGKSSIVATLARDDTVRIASTAGTTRKARRFPMRVNEDLLYELVDTPGIQRARSVLEWLNEHNTDVASRSETVRRFVVEHADDPSFEDEYQALKPIVDGAAIIYVVDGSCPFGSEYEPEMQILRWAGRPRLALINPIENDKYVDQWKAALGQYFTTVRIFNAHLAETSKQLDLLELFGYLDPEWLQPLRHAVTVLKEERRLQHVQASTEIVDLIVDAIGYKTEQSILKGVPEGPVRKLLFSQYKAHLVGREQQCRKRVEELFDYSDLQKSEEKLAFDETDLFDEEQWYLWGMGKAQMVATLASVGSAVGAGAGAAISAPSGIGIAFGAAIGAAVGATVTGSGAFIYADGIGKIKVKGIPTGGKRLSCGPTRNVNFPFVLLGRALWHHRLVSKRTHAARGKMDLGGKPLLDWMSSEDRRKLMLMFKRIRDGKKLEEQREQLKVMIQDWCLSVDEVSASN